MAKQSFSVGQVLTAAQMTSLQQTAMGGGSPSVKTASYVLVAADAGTVIQMNSASATTITVNTALFAAGDSVQIQNINTGVVTITAGTATVNSAGSLALSQWEGGFLYFTSASTAIFFDVVDSIPTSYGLSAGKNAIINSAFDIWQRGTSLASVAAYNNYTADRYPFNFGTNTTATISRQLTNDTTNLPFIQYCARMQRNNGATTVANLAIHYTLENQDTNRFIGQSVTFSFYARRGANYSSASNVLNIAFASGTGTDQSIANGLTGQTNFISSTATLTTTWQRFTYTGTVPTTATQIGFFAYALTSGTAGANDYFEMTGLQLELGLTATAFARNATTSQGELAACQRYYQKSYAQGTNPGSATADCGVDIVVPVGGTGAYYFPTRFPVEMRGTPTITIYDQAGTSGKVTKGANGKTAVVASFGSAGFTAGTSDATSATELIYQYTSSAEL